MFIVLFIFVLCFVWSMLTMSRECPFLIAPSGFCLITYMYISRSFICIFRSIILVCQIIPPYRVLSGWTGKYPVPPHALFPPPHALFPLPPHALFPLPHSLVKPPHTDIYLLLVFSRLALSSQFSRVSLHFLPLPNIRPTLKPFFSNLLLSHHPI